MAFKPVTPLYAWSIEKCSVETWSVDNAGWWLMGPGTVTGDIFEFVPVLHWHQPPTEFMLSPVQSSILFRVALKKAVDLAAGASAWALVLISGASQPGICACVSLLTHLVFDLSSSHSLCKVKLQ